MLGEALGAAGAARERGGKAMGWLRLVVREGWAGVPWGSAVVPERKPHWARWKAGGWLPLLEGLAADRRRWALLADRLAHTSSRSALNGPRGGRA